MIAISFTDNQQSHGAGGFSRILTFFEAKMYKMAVAFELAWPYGYVQLMSSYHWLLRMVWMSMIGWGLLLRQVGKLRMSPASVNGFLSIAGAKSTTWYASTTLLFTQRSKTGRTMVTMPLPFLEEAKGSLPLTMKAIQSPRNSLLAYQMGTTVMSFHVTRIDHLAANVGRQSTGRKGHHYCTT